MSLLDRVGSRLARKEEEEVAYNEVEEEELETTVVDPIEKVERWEIEQNASRRRRGNDNSSCYGSLPTSPSPPAAQDEEDQGGTVTPGRNIRLFFVVFLLG